jgi:RNA polymerase sigma-70 factor, ECF subfamily
VPSKETDITNHREETAEKDTQFKKLYLEHRDRIYWYIYRKISREDEAQDLTADVFLKLYENLEDVGKRKKGAVLAWLYTVARNLAIDHLRKQGSRKSRSLENEEIDGAAKVFDNFVNEAMKQSDIAEIQGVMASVDETAQEIMQLRFGEELQFNEISEVIGKSEGACKMILYRALGKMREEIERSREKKDSSAERPRKKKK